MIGLTDHHVFRHSLHEVYCRMYFNPIKAKHSNNL